MDHLCTNTCMLTSGTFQLKAENTVKWIASHIEPIALWVLTFPYHFSKEINASALFSVFSSHVGLIKNDFLLHRQPSFI